MKTFILILIFATFLQTTIVQINLVLLLLVCRSFIKEERLNYVLAFGVGIFQGILGVENIGFWPLILLVVVKLVYLFKKLPLTGNFLTIIPVGLIIILAVDYLQSFIFHTTVNQKQIIIETILILPMYLAVRFWEDRFEPPAEIKLKIKS